MFLILRMGFLTNIFQNVWETTIGKQIFEQNSFWTSNAGNIEHFFQKPQTVHKNLFLTIIMIYVYHLACFRGTQIFYCSIMVS